MTITQKALQLAEEALSTWVSAFPEYSGEFDMDVMTAIRAAIAQEQAEQPVSQEYQDHLANQSFDWAAMAAKHQFMEGYRIGLAEMREKCANVCDFENHQLVGMGMANEAWAAKNCAAAIRAIKFEGDTGFRPVSEMVGCAYCNNPLFAGTKCNNCGRITLAEQAEQEPVATHICNLWVDPITKEYVVDHCDHPIDELIPAYAAPVQQAEQEPVGKIVAFGGSLHEVSWRRGKMPPLGTDLYAAPVEHRRKNRE